MKKKILVFLLLLAAFLMVTGCTGGATAPKSTTPSTGAGEVKTTGEYIPPTLTIKEVQTPTGRFASDYVVNIEFTPNNETPAFFSNALRQKKPIFLEFYAEGDALTDAMVLGIDELQAEYRDRVVFLLLNGDRPQTYGNLSQQLPLKYTPQVLIFNKDGTIIRSFTGYVDKEQLEQGIYDAINRGY